MKSVALYDLVYADALAVITKRKTPPVHELFNSRHTRFSNSISGIWYTCTNFLSDCFIDEMSTGSDGLVYDCQCAPGYTCVPTGEFALDKGQPGE